MFELLFLGTSASAPSIRRNLPALLVKYEDQRYLIDCGEGTQRQILMAGCGYKKLNKIFLTHGHLDHILGIAGLMSTLMRWEDQKTMDIYGGNDTLERVKDLLYSVVLRGNPLPIELNFHTLSAGDILKEGELTIRCFPVIHRGTDSFGFHFEQKGRRPFLAEKAEALQIPNGPWRRELVNGKDVTLPDGRVIHADDVMGELRPGHILTVVGDCGDIDSIADAVQGSDTLVIESTYLEEEANLARKFSHMTARSSAALANRAGVKNLFLTHISRRYREKEILAEAQAVFDNTIVARDLTQYTVK